MQQDQIEQSVQPIQVLDNSNGVPLVPKEQNYEYGDFWTRLLALFIDGIIIGVFQLIVFLISPVFQLIFPAMVVDLFSTAEFCLTLEGMKSLKI